MLLTNHLPLFFWRIAGISDTPQEIAGMNIPQETITIVEPEIVVDNTSMTTERNTKRKRNETRKNKPNFIEVPLHPFDINYNMKLPSLIEI